MKSIVVAALLVVAMAAAKPSILPFPDNHPLIRTTTGATFREHVVDPTLPVIVFFYNPKQKASKQTAKAVEEAAEALQGYAKVAAFDGSTEEGQGLMQMFGAQNLPTLLYFNPELQAVGGGQEGQYMKMPLGFNGDSKDPYAVVNWGLQAMASDQIEYIEDMQDYDYFKSKYSFDMPKVILVTAGNTTGPGYKAVSHEYRYGSYFAAVKDVTPERLAAAAKAEVSPLGELLFQFLGLSPDVELPLVAVVSGTGNDVEILRPSKSEDGERFLTRAAVSEFVGQFALPKQRRVELTGMWPEEDKKRKKREQEDARMSRWLAPVLLTDKESWETKCLKPKKKNLCVAVFIEDTYEVDMEMLTSASKKMTQRTPATSPPPQIVVIHAWANHPLSEFFGAANAGYPAIVYINGNKGTYHSHIGSFQERSMVNFYADRMRSVKAKVYKKKDVPEFKVTPPPSKDDDEGGSDGAPSEEGVISDE